MKFKFSMDVVVEAGSVEEALGKVTSHISIVNRQQASGIADVAAEFTIGSVDDKTVVTDLTDKVTQSKGPIPLDLDPESPAGKAHAVQEASRKADQERAEDAKANEGKSDAEIMAAHSAKEQAALNG